MLGALGSAMRAPPTRVSNSNDFSGNSGPPKTCLSDRLMLVAREDVRFGDELLFDYGERAKEALQSFAWLTA